MRGYRSAKLFPLLLLLLALAGCAGAPGSLPTAMTGSGEGVGVKTEARAGDGAQSSHGMDCPISVPSITTPPDSEYRDPLPPGLYFVSGDKALWAVVAPWRQGSQKALWIKPVGSKLAVQGRRLDGDAAPLWAGIPDGYAGDFQASTLIFPTAGCWEIEARANASVLRFVYYIKPQPEPEPAPACVQIGDVVKPDRVIIVGRVERRALGSNQRWAWQVVRVDRSLYPYSLYREQVSPGAMLTILQDGEREPLLVQGEDYVLALRGDPWRLVCPQQTLAGIDDTQEPARLAPVAPAQSLWTGETVAAIEAQITAAQRAQQSQ